MLDVELEELSFCEDAQFDFEDFGFTQVNNNNDLDVSNLFIFKNMKKLEIQNPDISIEIIEKEDKITKNINIKADEMNIEYQERK